VWGYTEQNRQAKFYRLTPAGWKQLAAELARWKSYTSAVELVITAESGSAQ
jgi:DNA-binding PadR family transcriptional regulator